MMKPIQPADVQQYLHTFRNTPVYLHVEAPGSIVRNMQSTFSEATLKGDGPYRVALRSADRSTWIRLEGLADYELDDKGRLFLAEHDDVGRLIRGLTISREPLAF